MGTQTITLTALENLPAPAQFPTEDQFNNMPVTVDPTARLLVTGASGQLGQLVIKHLIDSLHVEPSHIIAGSRSPEKLQDLADRGVITRQLDFNDAASVEAAAQGVDRVLLISGNNIMGRLPGHKIAITALAAAGVKHILYTSLHNLDNSIAFIRGDHEATEQFIRESKVPGYTFLRNGIYFDNDVGLILGAKNTGKWLTAAKDGKIATISRNDLAFANALALASDNYENQIYELSGNVGLTVYEIVANVSEVVRKEIEVVQVSTDELAKRLAAARGLPEVVTKALVTLHDNTAAGLGGPLGEDFKLLTGRDPQSHKEWLQENRALFA